jgi:hypothetical protein
LTTDSKTIFAQMPSNVIEHGSRVGSIYFIALKDNIISRVKLGGFASNWPGLAGAGRCPGNCPPTSAPRIHAIGRGPFEPTDHVTLLLYPCH